MSCPHEPRSARFVIGDLSSDARLQHARHAHGCPACRAALSDALIGDVLLEQQLPALYSAPPQRRWPALVTAAAVAALALVVVSVGALAPQTGSPQLGTRGGGALSSPTHLSMTLAVETEQGTARLHRDQSYAVGDEIVFQVRADPPTAVYLWARHEGQLHSLAQHIATPSGELLREEGQLLRYRITATGSHQLFLSSQGMGECGAGCVEEEVQVR